MYNLSLLPLTKGSPAGQSHQCKIEISKTLLIYGVPVTNWKLDHWKK